MAGASLKKKIGIGVLVVVLVVAGLFAWKLAPMFMPPESVEAGIARGAQAPVAMPLRNAAGEPTTLADQMGENGLLLVLVRSADWCPFCKLQLEETEAIRGNVAKEGYGLASLSYDDPAKLAAFAQEKGIGYAMLSDEGSKMIDALGLRDPQYEEGNFAYGVPRATILILAPDGSVKDKFVAADYVARPSNEMVLELLRGAS